ncbi:MAG: PqqD family protein [Ruminococcus sp.]|uniref:PqqD family protein n=1 Tax=Ruminococcus sp. TaxID=41978 RepID=UPI0025D6C410|nr:PqqD family protein [Ruminococcus sp.]MCR5539744.1 PqqD family protein [Ruminococcus sp.]
MKLAVEMAVMELDGEWNAVAVGEDSSKFRGMMRLNESAADIIKLLAEETTNEKLLADMQTIYPDNTADELTRGIDVILAKLRAEGLLEE